MNYFKRIIFRLGIILIPLIYGVVFYFSVFGTEVKSAYIITTLICGVIFHIFNMVYEGYRVGVYRVREIIYSNFLSIVLTNIFSMIILFFLRELNIIECCIAVLIQSIILIIWSVSLNKLFYSVNNYHNFLLVYGRNPKDVIDKLAYSKRRYAIKDTISDKEDSNFIIDKLRHHDAIFLYDINRELKDKITLYCFRNNISLYHIPTIPEIIRTGLQNIYLIDSPIFFKRYWGLSLENRFLKRLLDLIIIIPVAIIASPFMLVTGIAIKLYDGGPILYSQTRLTLNGKTFKVYKFRSMIVDAEKKGARLASENDDRITPVGRIIRKIRFDELPQILNILKGDMSIVGPRPERPEIADEYLKVFPEFDLRLKTKAGLTGYAQVYGKYNTTPQDKLKFDLLYIQNYSIFLDIKLIIYTIKILFDPTSTEGIDEGATTAQRT